MSTEKLSKYLPRQADGRVAVVWLVFVAVVCACVAVNVALLVQFNPGVTGQFLQGVLLLGGVMVTVSLMGRVEKLEKLAKARGATPEAPGPFAQMIADAKAAARLAGKDEQDAQLIAQEVLSTCIRRNGGWQA
jgi:hypothetical protein